MANMHLEQAADGWQSKIEELQKLLEQIKPRLITAEAELAERLAAISAFEFQVRARLEPLTRRLEEIEDQIKQVRKQLNEMREAWFFIGDMSAEELDAWREELDFAHGVGAAASGDFRYHEAPAAPPQKPLSQDEQTALKQMYRQLARRFHPDFSIDEEDRAFRTQVMMAINAAYAAGDISRLEEIAQQPDRADQTSYSGQVLAEALWRELVHCQNRLKEIKQELIHLEKHDSARLMRRSQKAAEEGWDLIAELAKELREKIAHKLIQRDVLKEEIESFVAGKPDFASDHFAEAIYDLGLEHVLEDDGLVAFSEWRDKHQGVFDLDDEPEDETWINGLRKHRQQKGEKPGKGKSKHS